MSTFWYFWERLSKKGKDSPVFNEIRGQIMAKLLSIKKGNMQGATFIEADMGEYGKPGRDDTNTRRSRDCSSATENNEKHFGYIAPYPCQ